MIKEHCLRRSTLEYILFATLLREEVILAAMRRHFSDAHLPHTTQVPTITMIKVNFGVRERGSVSWLTKQVNRTHPSEEKL